MGNLNMGTSSEAYTQIRGQYRETLNQLGLETIPFVNVVILRQPEWLQSRTYY